MVDVVKPEKANLFIAGLRLFRAHWRAWAELAAWFFIALSAVQSIAYDPAFQTVVDKLRVAAHEGHKMTPEEIEMMKYVVSHGAWRLGIVLLFILLQDYTYMVLFLKQPPVIGQPVFSFGRFFYMIWKVLQIVVMVFVVAAICIGVPMGIAAALMKMKSPFSMVPSIVALIGAGFTYYVVFKYMLVTPLAVSGVKPALRTSWNLMKGNWWRVFGNTLLFGIVVFVLMFAAVLVEKAIINFLLQISPSIFGMTTPDPVATPTGMPPLMEFFSPVPVRVQSGLAPYVGIVFGMLNACVFAGLGKAFHCAILRVLYSEQQATTL